MSAQRRPQSLDDWLRADLAGTLGKVPQEPSRCRLLDDGCAIQSDFLVAQADIPALGVRCGEIVSYVAFARAVIAHDGRGELPFGAWRAMLTAIQAGSLRPAMLCSLDEAVARRWDWDGLVADVGPQQALAVWREALSALAGERLRERGK